VALKGITTRFANPTFTGTGRGVPMNLVECGIPFIVASSGSMADNGALTALTALPETYSGGCYLYLPANAISAGSAAGWYWAVMSSTTAGTVYNSTYTTGIPAAGTATAFVTTGPGAFTGHTGVVAVTIPIPILLANSTIRYRVQFQNTNSGNNKTHDIKFSGSGGTQVYANILTTTTFAYVRGEITNSNNTGKQISIASVAGSVDIQALPAADTSAATSLYINTVHAVATDNAVIRRIGVEILYGPAT
jgi:hypothetical protein